MKKKLTVGILAHVDAGKTTLSEALLYVSGKIRTLGRVDHGNTFLDNFDVERERGITVFSKQARFSTEKCDFILLDTPGHVDFSAETERTLSLLDYAVLVVSAPEGVQNHTRTLWQLLEHYRVPTFIFVNKTDVAVKPHEQTESDIASALSDNCVAFFEHLTKRELDEKLATVNEGFLEAFLADEPIADEDIAELVSRRELFPIAFGSALKLNGIDNLLSLLDKLTLSPVYDGERFGAKVYKIARAGSERLTYMRITGGSLRTRDEIVYLSEDGKKHSEKVSRIRLYSADRFEQVDVAEAGEICAVCGLTSTYVGLGLGAEANSGAPLLEPVLSYRIALPEGCDISVYYPKFKELEEEEPSLHLCLNHQLQQIEVRLMGDIQTELLTRMIKERCGISVTLDTGKILYKEKVAARSLGVGHFEPLRHYAEVQLLLEPLPKGSGTVIDSHVPENTLDTNWQRLILSHLYEKTHLGILTGAALTDTKITLVAGKAHLKHTEGGDFREATYRAVRQGLMRVGCVLLEPYYKFRLTLPSAFIGRAMSDLQMRFADFMTESASETETTLIGRAPVSSLHGYQRELTAYTRGEGRLSCVSDGYEPCHNADEVAAEAAYDPEADLENTPHSVFCAHGAGFLVPWNEVDSYKHLEADVTLDEDNDSPLPSSRKLANRYSISQKEIDEIMLRTFGANKKREYAEPKTVRFSETKHVPKRLTMPKRRLTIVDGYNFIFSVSRLKSLAERDLEKAREELSDMLESYVAYTKTELILVFDAYLVKNGAGSDKVKNGLRTVYTAKDQTADAFIEKLMSTLGPNYNVRVVTGDRLLQFSAVHSGIIRVTAKEFEDEMVRIGNEITEYINRLAQSK